MLGQRIPNRRASDRRTSVFDPTLMSMPSEAVRLSHQAGGLLQLFSRFGADPLDGRGDLQQLREDAFAERFPCFELIYHQVVNDDCTRFEQSLLFFINLTERLSSTMNY